MPPTHVSYIFRDYVGIDNETDAFIRLINNSKYQDRMFRDQQGLKIRFMASKPIFEKNDFLEVLQFLNNANLPFSVDKEWGPSEIMQEFQERGLLLESFVEIFWKGPGDWHCRTIYPPSKKSQS